MPSGEGAHSLMAPAASLARVADVDHWMPGRGCEDVAKLLDAEPGGSLHALGVVDPWPASGEGEEAQDAVEPDAGETDASLLLGTLLADEHDRGVRATTRPGVLREPPVEADVEEP